MVAKSYQQYPVCSKPFVQDGKKYVKILLKNGSTKAVRYYTEEEYEKLYPTPIVKIKPLKEVLGFNKGYITIFKGNVLQESEWFLNSIARYHRLWGWYIVSTDEVPELPSGISPVKLEWSCISIDQDTLKKDSEIIQIVEDLKFDPSSSSYVGNIGDTISLELLVKTAISGYGNSHFYVLEDPLTGNIFTWSTTSNRLQPRQTYLVTGTVKEHKKYHNEEQTVLTRCRIK